MSELASFVTDLEEGNEKRTAERNQAENTRPGEFITVAEQEAGEDLAVDEKIRRARQQLSRIGGLTERMDTPEGFAHFEDETLRLLFRLQNLCQSAANLHGYGGRVSE